MTTWHTNEPPDGVFVLTKSPSGYTTTPFVYMTARKERDFRGDAWITVGSDRLSDYGLEPVAWTEHPTETASERSKATPPQEQLKIVISGNPVDGFTYAGPVDDDYVDRNSDGFEGDWWTAPIAPIAPMENRGGGGIPNLDDCDKGDNLLYIEVFRLLHAYSFHAYAAKLCREKGDIETATKHETNMRDTYGKLPHWARW